MDELIALVLKGGDKIPVLLTGMDDPKLKALADTHGAGSIMIGESLLSDLLAKPEPVVEPAAEAADVVEVTADAPAESGVKAQGTGAD